MAAGTGAIIVALVLALQYFNTARVSDALCSRLSGQDDCGAETTLASVRLLWQPDNLPVGVEVPPLRPHATASLLRRTCDNGWTVGVGARVEVDDAAVTSDMAALRVGRACVDTDGAGASGVIADAHVTSRGCEVELAPIRFSTGDALRASLTARIAAATVPACALLLQPAMREAAVSALAGASLALEVRYGGNRGGPASTGSSDAANEAARGFTSRLLSSIDTSHDLAVTLGGGRASFHLDTEPARESAVLTLSVKADRDVAALLPEDVRPQGAGPLALEVGWSLHHESGEVRVNGETIRRIPLEPTRAEGRVALDGSECEAGAAGQTRSLFFVEAGDRGEALRPSQLDGVFTAVDGAAARAGALVAVFVHGWHHSASPRDAYVCRFSEVLGSVEEMEVRAAGIAGRSPRQVIGIYVGWPGALYPNELANSVTTFWNRLDAADRLGAKGATLNRLLAGLSQRLAASRVDPRADRRSSLIVVGHSMGARAVFNALHDDLADTEPAASQAPGPDLVLLVNPAFSATLYRRLHERNRACAGRAPLLLFSSESDGVTRQIYPAGQTVTYPYTRQHRAPFLEYVYTAPNFAEFVTHRLRLETVSGDPPAAGGAQTILRGFERIPSGSKELYSDNPVVVFRQPSIGRPLPGNVWYRMLLVDAVANPPPCGVATAMSKVIEVDRQILPDHGTIFTPPFVEYVVRVLNRRALDSRAPR